MKSVSLQHDFALDLQQEVTLLRKQVTELTALVKHYEQQFLWLKRRQFGASSEKTDAGLRQMSLFAEAEPVVVLEEPETEEISYSRKKRKGKREEALSGLPTERVDYELSEEDRRCPQCSGIMRDIGVDIRRELELIPAQVIVKEHAAHSYACSHCDQYAETTPVVRAKAPKPLLSGSLASPSLVAHIAAQKYQNAMPLYRLEKGFAYDGVTISRQNMTNWIIQCSENYLEAIYMRLVEHLLKESVLHVDETTFQVLREAGRAAQSKSYAWLYRSSGCSAKKIVVYNYQETRKQEHPRAFLKGFHGYLHTDGYQVYHHLPDHITVVGCWAHVRRKFEGLLKTLPKEKRKDAGAQQGLAFCNELFRLEREFADLTPQERYEQRLEHSKPVAEAFFTWADACGALPKSSLGDAAGYALSQRTYLNNVFLDGRLELSNNRAENSIRPFVVGRKNWLFANSPAGARASMVIYSLLETAKGNGLHPFHYLEFLLHSLPNITSSTLDELLPWSENLPVACHAPCKDSNISLP